MDKITFCIPSKSNLQYLKTCIPSIRKNAYRDDHDIIIFVDSDEDGTVKWLEQVKDEYNLIYHVNPKLGEELYGIGRAYDFCIEKSTTDVFMIFHADMILGKNADLNSYKQLKSKSVVCATRIEPPLHPNGGEKILQDFGMYPNDFKETEFIEFIATANIAHETTEGIFAPWMMYKKDFLEILGGHDPILHSCREDSDVFNRMLLSGFTFIQTWEGFVYHFTGRGAGSFDGDEERHDFWKQQMMNSTKDFIRKWGQNVNHTPLMKPIVSPKYNIGIRVENCSQTLLGHLEPWCDIIYTDGNIDDYIAMEQPKTSFDLSKRLHRLTDNDKNDYDDILVEIDGNKFSQQDFTYIQKLSEIITDSGEEKLRAELGNIVIEIFNMNTYELDLVKVK